jgi:alpha-tubulin suppressor-like RCC1 family protein
MVSFIVQNDQCAGQLSLDHKKTQFEFTPVVKDFHDNVRLLAAGSGHTIIVTETNEMWGCGNNERGSLGDALLNKQVFSFINLREARGKITQLGCGYRHTFFVTQDKDLWLMGDNQYYQCGQEKQGVIVEPMKVDLDGTHIQASCGNFHTAVIVDHNRLVCFGNNG